MKAPTHNEMTIKALLYRIASVSPMQERVSTHLKGGKVGKNTRNLSMSWKTPEAALVWAIYERSVQDHFAINTSKQGFGQRPAFPNATAKTGMVDLPSGKEINILELLGIDPSWAWAQIRQAVNGSYKLAA